MPYPEGLSLHTIWDDIACHIDSTENLLSLALTCRTFKELIIPDHLEYRHIRCDLRRDDVWRFLASRPRLTTGIRFVDLIFEPTESVRLPHVLGWDEPDRRLHVDVPVTYENMALFKNALSHMVFLKLFSWNQYHTSPPEITDISSVLTNTTHCLEALCVNFCWIPSDGHDQAQVQFEHLSVWSLTGLKKVIIRQAGPSATQMIVHLCPDIEDLCLLDTSIETFLYIMQHANWEKLRRLNLSMPTRLPPGEPAQEDIHIYRIITSFFSRHIKIESLYLDLFDIQMPQLPESYLPKLRSIGSNNANFVLTSFLTSDTLSGLVHWQCPLEDIEIEILPTMDRLESLYISTYRLREYFVPLLEKAPNLKKMYLDIGVSWEVDLPKILVNSRQCSKLTHLLCETGFPLIMNNFVKRGSFSEGVCKKLSSLPALKYITQRDEEMGVKLERDQDGRYSGLQFVTLQDVGERPDCWGDFFCNLSD